MGNKQGGRPRDTSRIAPTDLGAEFDFVAPEHRVDTLEGRFTTIKILGSGTTARVLAVRDPETGKEFAMKEMQRKDPNNTAIFIRESQILQKLLHDNIVTLHQCYIDWRHFYILTDLCTGGQLLQKVKRLDHFSEVVAANILKQLLSAIAFLHEHNIVHRDIKPENVVFAHPGDDARVVLVDYGGAVEIDHTKSYSDWVGSPAYMAPETLRPRTGDELKASDVWSVGVTAYQLLTGQYPFWGDDMQGLFREIASKRITFPPEIELSEHAMTFIRQMLRRNTTKRLTARFASASPWLHSESHQSSAHLDHWGDHIANYQDASRFKKLVVNFAVAQMDDDEKKSLDDTFDLIDDNNDGSISEKELTSYLLRRGISTRTAETRAHVIVAQADTTRDHTMSRDEFYRVHWAEEIADESFLRKTFDKLDHNGDGHISLEELKSTIEEFIGRSIEFEEAALFLNEIDTNGDGMISFQEFNDGMRALSSRKVVGLYGHTSVQPY